MTATALRSDDLLREAGSLLDNATRESISGWPRAVALLTRIALETRLDACWTAIGVSELARLDMRAQLNCARVLLGPAVAGELSFAWYALSRATHHRTYELDPTADELRSLIASVQSATATMAAAVRDRRGT